mmetsp:Transcript_69224/g.175957  ORF Transcript_69224/g.175957 Transcript_69224/m.175957 type:complete len:201 (-) Transcript_69224:1039-1641(-)
MSQRPGANWRLSRRLRCQLEQSPPKAACLAVELVVVAMQMQRQRRLLRGPRSHFCGGRRQRRKRRGRDKLRPDSGEHSNGRRGSRPCRRRCEQPERPEQWRGMKRPPRCTPPPMVDHGVLSAVVRNCSVPALGGTSHPALSPLCAGSGPDLSVHRLGRLIGSGRLPTWKACSAPLLRVSRKACLMAAEVGKGLPRCRRKC